MTDENIGINGVEETKETKEGLQLLLDSTYPLLKKFREACPGTYKHSQALVSMMEGIAISLGLDINKMKVIALYHDIGKMFNPNYFTENQLDDENPHDDLDPMVSFNIITRHVSDSVVILINDGNFPRDIIEIISQHHGTSVLKYFFNKSGADEENMFRYRTPCPMCIESAILMIADQIEATARSLVQHNKLDSADTIETTINNLLNDGQLDAVYMKLGDLKKIKTALAMELSGMWQKRVDYSEIKAGSKGEEGDEFTKTK